MLSLQGVQQDQKKSWVGFTPKGIRNQKIDLAFFPKSFNPKTPTNKIVYRNGNHDFAK